MQASNGTVYPLYHYALFRILIHRKQASNQMRKIELSGVKNQGIYTLVDDDDYEDLSKYTWMRHPDGSVIVVFYGGVNATNGRGFYQRERMHRYIMQPQPEMVVDHINGDSLDNRKSNLRVCTQRDNSRNKHFVKNSSGYKGVRKGRIAGSWDAYIMCDGYSQYLGRAYDSGDAALLYDMAAIQLFGDFAHLNLVGKS